MSYQEVVSGSGPGIAWGHLAWDAARVADLRSDQESPAVGAWRARAIAAFRQAEPGSATLRAEMAARLRSLNGLVVAPERIHADAATRTATAE